LAAALKIPCESPSGINRKEAVQSSDQTIWIRVNPQTAV
jgi:hypothetical protein